MGLRIAAVSDLDAILSIYKPYVENTTVSFEYEAPSMPAFRERFLQITAQFPWLVWEEHGQIVGYAYACSPFARDAYRWCAEPSIYLHPDFRGIGIGRKLYHALETLLCMQGYQVSYAIITSENTGSLAFHKAMGYSVLSEFPRCAWKFGKNLGIFWMEKRLNFAEMPSNPPISFPGFVKNNKNFKKILDTLSLS